MQKDRETDKSDGEIEEQRRHSDKLTVMQKDREKDKSDGETEVQKDR